MRNYLADIWLTVHPSALNALLLLLSSEFGLNYIQTGKTQKNARSHKILDFHCFPHRTPNAERQTSTEFMSMFFKQLIHVYEMIYDSNFNNLFS